MLQALAKMLSVATHMVMMHDIKEMAISKCQDGKMAESKVCRLAATQNASACSFRTKASIEIIFTDIGTMYNNMFT